MEHETKEKYVATYLGHFNSILETSFDEGLSKSQCESLGFGCAKLALLLTAGDILSDILKEHREETVRLMREQNEKNKPPMTEQNSPYSMTNDEKMRNTTFDYLWSTLGVSSLSDITGWAKDANNGGKYYLMIKGRLAEAGDSFTQDMFSTLKTMMDECGCRFFHYSAPTSKPLEECMPL